MDRAYLITASLCFIGLIGRTSYELLKKGGRVDTKNKIIFAAVFAAMCIMLGGWPAISRLDPWRIVIPSMVRWIGLGTLAAALTLAIGGLIQLRGVENIDHLVTAGLFSRFRHPMYTGFILWIIGWIILYGAVGSIALGLACVGNILYWRHLEEAALESLYGESYRNYRRGTWF
jgi:protein-S-isoprenylcysteine O-methyltransferase Ste14